MIKRLYGWNLAAIAAVFSILLLGQSAFATPMDDGIKAYNAKNYRAALTHFGNAGRLKPTDPTVYYYLGLCYQGMRQTALARQNFEWVAANAGNSQIGAQAQMALAQLNKSNPGQGTSTVQITMSPGATATASGPSEPIVGRLKILEFWTSW